MQNFKAIALLILKDLVLMLVLALMGHLIIMYSTGFAVLVGEPAFSAWGLFTGGVFYITALSHALRRMYFYPLSLQSIAKRASLTAVGAGLVFLGMCLVLAAFVMVLGGMLRV